MRKILLLIMSIGLVCQVAAQQTVTGKISDDKNEALECNGIRRQMDT